MLRRNCDAAIVLDKGRLTWFDDVAEAIDVHEGNMRAVTLDTDQ